MISAEMVTQTLEKMSEMKPKQATSLVNRMRVEQPAVLAYLLASGENSKFDEEDSQTLLYIGIVVWQLMRQNPNGSRQVSLKRIEKAEKMNDALLEKMESDSAGDFVSATQSVVENYPEPEVLRYITQALIEGDPNTPPVGEEKLGYAFLHLKILLDTFIAAQK